MMSRRSHRLAAVSAACTARAACASLAGGVLLVSASPSAPAALLPPVPVANISTGIDPLSGQKIANNAPDSKYVIAPGGTGGSVGQTPIARSDPLPSIYLPDNASAASRWIALNSGQGIEGISVPAGTYYFQTTVSLTGFDPTTASIPSSNLAADDGLAAILVNGHTAYAPSGSTDTPIGNFEALPANLGAGAFTAGTNTITLEVVNNVFSPMALRFEAQVTASPLPEPGGAGVAAAAGGLGLLARRRRRPPGGA